MFDFFYASSFTIISWVMVVMVWCQILPYSTYHHYFSYDGGGGNGDGDSMVSNPSIHYLSSLSQLWWCGVMPFHRPPVITILSYGGDGDMASDSSIYNLSSLSQLRWWWWWYRVMPFNTPSIITIFSSGGDDGNSMVSRPFNTPLYHHFLNYSDGDSMVTHPSSSPSSITILVMMMVIWWKNFPYTTNHHFLSYSDGDGDGMVPARLCRYIHGDAASSVILLMTSWWPRRPYKSEWVTWPCGVMKINNKVY